MYRMDGYRSHDFTIDLRNNRAEGNCYTVLIGPNGTGKSRLLGEIARSATYPEQTTRQDHAQQPTKILAISNLVTDNFPFPRQPAPQYRYLGLRQASNSMTTGAVQASLAQYLTEIELSNRTTFDVNTLTHYIGIPNPSLKVIFPKSYKDPIKINRRVLQIVESNDNRLNWNVLDGIQNEISNLVHTYEIEEHGSDREVSRDYIEFRSDFGIDNENQNPSARPTFKYLAEYLRSQQSIHYVSNQDAVTLLQKRFGIRLKVDFGKDRQALSGGQALLLSMIFRLMAAIEPSSLILIDEPETGLHPEWQADFIRLIDSLVPSDYGCHFLIATHSPYIAANATNILSPNVDSGFDEFKTDHRGMSIESLIYKVFETRVVGNYSTERDLTTVVDWISQGTAAADPLVNDAARRLKIFASKDSPTLNSILSEFEQMVEGIR